MANEILHSSIPNKAFYIQIENAARQIWNGTAFETFSAANWGNYDIAMTERAGTGKYVATWPSAITGGRYTYTPFLQNGALPAVGDLSDGDFVFDWTGTAEAGLQSVKLAANGLDSILTTAPSTAPSTWNFREMLVMVWRDIFRKSVLSKTADTLSHYADNGSTVLATSAVSDNGTLQTKEAAV